MVSCRPTYPAENINRPFRYHPNNNWNIEIAPVRASSRLPENGEPDQYNGIASKTMNEAMEMQKKGCHAFNLRFISQHVARPAKRQISQDPHAMNSSIEPKIQQLSIRTVRSVYEELIGVLVADNALRNQRDERSITNVATRYTDPDIVRSIPRLVVVRISCQQDCRPR